MYIGSRPKAPLEHLPPPTEADVNRNENLKAWLEKRKITPSFFCHILAGEAPAKPTALPDPVLKAVVAPQFKPEPIVIDHGHQDSWSPAYPAAPTFRRQDTFPQPRYCFVP